MKRKLFLIITVFCIIPTTIFVLILLSLYFIHENSNNDKKGFNLFSKQVEFKAYPEKEQKAETQLTEEDIRLNILNEFFARYKSPLFPYSQNILEAADKYNLDYRLLPAIAMQESNLCKKMPKNSFNCWGFGIYGKKVTRFSGYEEAIERVSKILALEYKEKGYNHPEEIMQKYTPSNNGSWAKSVSFFMERLAVNL